MSEVRPTNKVITLLVTCLGTFMILLDTSIVVLALPRMQVALHANLSDLQWVVDAYTLPFAVFMLTAGTFGDRFGRKRMFMIGLVVFVIGSATCGLAPTLSWLLFGRAMQGIGAAALSTNSLAVLVAAFSEPRARAQAIGLFSGISGVALALGPLAGGILVQVGDWPLIFFVNLPIGLIAFILAWPGLSESRNPHARRIDVSGQLLVIAGLTCLIIAIVESSSQGWTSPWILGLLAGAVVLLAVFVLVETRVREPLLPLQLFRIPLFSASNIVALVFGFAQLGPIFFLSQYFQQVQGYSVLDAGLRTLPTSIGAVLTAPLAGRLAGRIGPRVPTALGGVICGGAILLLTLLQPDSNYAPFGLILGLMGVGFGLMLSPITAAVFSVTPPNRTGLGSSMLNTSRQLGGTLGIAVLGTVVLQMFSNNIVSQLTQRGVSRSISTTTANQIAAVGAGKSSLLKHLPISPVALHQAINQAFVDALHEAFLISALALFVAVLLVMFTFKRNQVAEKREAIAEATVEAAVNINGR